LELIQSKEDSGPSLLKSINFTLTKMGKRLLRMSILQPLCDYQLITNRLDAVQELNTFPNIVDDLRSDLKGFPDLDGLLRGMNVISQKPSVKKYFMSFATNTKCRAIN
jgi:DNA mismatch repair ATPase MutS